MSSALVETININADDFTDNFLTCPTCMSAYDDTEHSPKLLPCSHTLCRNCLERIASTAIPVNNGSGLNLDSINSSPTILINNSISRSVAAADAAVAAINLNSNGTLSNQNQFTNENNATSSPHLNTNGSRLSNSSLTSTNHANTRTLTHNQSQQIIDLCIRCPICRETIILPRNGGIFNLPPSFIINQLIDLVKNRRSRDIIPRCINHTNEELLFCETCDKSFCSLCESHFKMATNADHIIIPFSIAIKRMTEIFLFKSNQCINSFNLALANVQNEILNLNQIVENVAQSVEKSFDELKQVIDKRKQSLLKELTKIKETKTNLLNDQIKLIINEKQKVELECKQYHQVNIESKQLGAQIQNINEKLDCLRTLCEPRENSFINYEYKFNNCIQEIDKTVQHFGRFKISNTYPPLCSYRIIEDSCQVGSSNNVNNTYPANLSIQIQIETVDYYGNKRTEGDDPLNILITDPYSQQQNFKSPIDIIDLNNGIYTFKFIPNIVGKYRIDINIFSRPINKMPLYLNITEHIDSLWIFGGSGMNNRPNLSQIKSFTLNNKGSSEKEFNMPISVRCLNDFIYVLDSGNNRIKVLNQNGQFVSHIKHCGLFEFSSTALAIYNADSLMTLNWRLKYLSIVSLSDDSNLINNEIKIDEPICLMETYHPQIFILQDNKKNIYLITYNGNILLESLEDKLKKECGLKNLTSFCGNFNQQTIFVADATNSNSPNIYEIDLDWLCNFKLESFIESKGLIKFNKPKLGFNHKKYSYPTNQKALSSSLTSLISTISSTSTATTCTSNSANLNSTINSSISTSMNSKSSSGSYTALWHDSKTDKLLAAKSDKHKTTIEIYNSNTSFYEYSIENSQNEKQLKRVTSICSTTNGKVVCVDLVQNFVKMFRFT